MQGGIVGLMGFDGELETELILLFASLEEVSLDHDEGAVILYSLTEKIESVPSSIGK